MRRFWAAMAAVSLLASITAAPAGAVAPPYEVVAGGLVNPRGLTFGPGGRLYVAEAGNGAGPGLGGFGLTGRITEIVAPGSSSPTTRTVVSGLASVSGDEGAVGVDGISALGNGGIYAIMALSPDATGSPAFGKLLKVSTDGDIRTVADVGHANYVWTGAHPELDPGGQYPDANPYGVLALPGHTYVVDAGANTLNDVSPNGTVHILAYVPNNITSDSTPTCVAQGPDGMLYIGTLSLVDSIVFGPSAKVYRVDPSKLGGSTVAMLGSSDEWATGLWPINGCAFGPDGSFYASALFTGFGAAGPTGGDVVKIPWGSPATHVSLTGGSLPLAGGVAVSNDGTVYAAALTAFAPTGFVARLANH